MNILDHCFKFCEFLLVADDRTLVQDDLNLVLNWCKLDGLNFINYCTYCFNNEPLVLVDKIKDLGIVFYYKLKFDKHIEFMQN